MTGGEWGYTVPPDQAGGDVAHALAEAGAHRPSEVRLSPQAWVRLRLFNGWFNSIVTVVLGALLAVAAYRLGRFVFVTGQWEAVDRNLELFMIGQFPREERWRIIAQVIILSAAIGLALGSMRATARDRARENGVPFVRESWRTYAASYWAAALLLLVLLVAFSDGIGPWLVALASIAAAVAGWALAAVLPHRLRLVGWTLAALAAVIEFQMLSGTGGAAWFFTTVALTPLVVSEVGRLAEQPPRALAFASAAVAVAIGAGRFLIERDGVGLATLALAALAVIGLVRRRDTAVVQLAAVMVTGLVVALVDARIGLSGVDWADWGGFHLNLVATVVAIALAMPLGIVLALGRRSKLPAIRVMSIAYIEFFRGVPLITLLLAANFFLGFFLDTDTPLSLITRAIAAVTLFSGAYIAEIIRGGLQAVPPGQVEAGMASGLSQLSIMRLIVMPQALRAVIPAMVGQFISLFKDTSLFSIIAINELLNMREVVHAQEAFRSVARAETLVFVAFGFWAMAFTMSRESQRLERRLGVGER